MTRIFDQVEFDRNHRMITCTLYDGDDCIALFSCLFELSAIKMFHVDSLRPSAINVGIEYQTFINRCFRMVREGLSPDEASVLDI